jgi:hypothetical protein
VATLLEYAMGTGEHDGGTSIAGREGPFGSPEIRLSQVVAAA